MTQDEARHLLTRTGFAPSQSDVNRLLNQAIPAAVNDILQQAQESKTLGASPEFVNAPPPVPYKDVKTPEERQALRRQQNLETLQIKTWWVQRMLATSTPLLERMTLFWHNHFATSQQKVAYSQVMWQQHVLLRADALGSFKSLLHNVIKDPAMLIYLDNTGNRKGAPNENLARELFELFTLGESSSTRTGEGGYTETDVKEAARALTGWSFEPDTGKFLERDRIHDFGNKTILGKTGNFDGHALLDILLAQPQTARHITRKLWLEFISTDPDNSVIERMASSFVQSGYDIATLLKTIFTSNAFWSPANRGALIKSPLELLVGVTRQFGVEPPSVESIYQRATQLGQNLLNPPNVKGWPGGAAWINATTLLDRKRMTENIFRINRKMNPNASPNTGSEEEPLSHWLSQYNAHPDREPDAPSKAAIQAAMLALPPTQGVPAGTVGVAYVRALTLDPVFQLK